MSNSNVKVGVTGWDEANNTGTPREREDLPRYDFLRLKNGINVLRIVTPPHAYYHARYKGPNDGSQFGRRVNTAWPMYEKECPAYNEAGLKPKKRYLAGVIDRSDDSIKIFDMGVLVYEGLKSAIEDLKNEWESEHGESKEFTPCDFDISIKYNSKATTPAGFYTVNRRSPKPLSEADQALLKEQKETLLKVLERQTTCPKPERVRARLEAMGWTGGLVQDGEVNSSSAKSSEKSSDEDDDDQYSFEKPSEAVAN